VATPIPVLIAAYLISHSPVHPILRPSLQNGPTCKYRHALPPGYQFKTKREREAEAAARASMESNVVSLEEQLEEERKKLPTTGACEEWAGRAPVGSVRERRPWRGAYPLTRSASPPS
jgi:hypothetical protein